MSHGHEQTMEKPILPSMAAWFAFLIFCLFTIGIANFIRDVSHDSEGHGAAHETTTEAPAHH